MRSFWEFQNINMPVKFAIALVMLLAGLVFMGSSYYQILEIEEQAKERDKSLAEFSKLISSVALNIGEARFLEINFQLEKGLHYLNEYNTVMEKVDEDIESLQQYLRSDADRNIVGELHSIIDDYQNTFYEGSEAAIEAGLSMDEGLSADLSKVVDQAEVTVEYANQAWLDERFRMFRSQLNEFDSEKAPMVAQTLGAISNYARSTTIKEDTGLLNQLSTQMKDVQDVYDIYSVAIARRDNNFGRISDLIGQLPAQYKQLDELTAAYNRQNELQRDTEAEEVLRLFFSTMALMILALVIAISIVKWGVMDPVRRIQDTIDRVREGDVTARTELDAGDELGQLSSVLDQLLDEKEAAIEQKEKENKQLNSSIIELIQNVFRLSQRDLTVRVPVAEDVTGAIADSINQLAESIETVLHDVNAVSNRVNDASQQVKTQSSAVLDSAIKEQEEVVQTLDGLESAIRAMQLIAKLASLSNSASQKAIRTSETAMESVSETIESINKIRQTINEAEKRIKRLGERSQEIGGIVSLINNISERTHILSLNASMHAASAGEAGRGLMVVVDEVQRLAENSREATSEIESLVNNIQLETADTINVMNNVISDVVNGTRLAEEAGERMDETRATTQTLVESVLRIAQNATRQAKVAEELRERATTIDESARNTNAQMLQQTKLSDDLVQAADELQSSIKVFKLAESV